MRILYIFFITVFLVSCSKSTNLATDHSSLRNLSAQTDSSNNISPIRAEALRDTALSVGARGGLAFRANQINNLLLKDEKFLLKVFNFQGMILEDNILPPVLIEARKTLTIANNDLIRIADQNYQILKQAKFITAPPVWSDYLLLSYKQPELPDKSLLPRNKGEELVWAKYIDEGWKAGVLQAELIFNENKARLHRDLQGMILYKKLLFQNMVSPPYVAEVDLGITGDKDHLNINDRILRITAFPSLNSNGNQWKTEIKRND